MFNRRNSRRIGSKRHTLRWILFVIVVVILGLGLWVGSTVFKFLGNVTADSGKNPFSQLLSFNSKLQGEDQGRTNILLLGYGGSGHSGGNLSDTMDVLSIDWVDKKMAMISIPRDLWVKVQGFDYSKINAAHSDGVTNPKTTGGGGQLASTTVSQVLGVPIHYYIAMDFNGFKNIVNSVGGVDINVENSFTDYTYPKSECNDATGVGCAVMTVHFAAGPQHMDGDRALIYSRSRHSLDNGEGTDFARSRRQQLLMLAIKNKVLSVGVLANPIKITGLLNSIGIHLTTNLSINEIKSLWDKTQTIDQTKIINYVFDTSSSSPLTSGVSANGQDIIFPKKGIGDYTDMQYIARNIFQLTAAQLSQGYTISPAAQAEIKPKTSPSPSPTASSAKPRIEVLNAGSSIDSVNKLAQTLKSSGYKVVYTGDTNDTYRQTTIYLCAKAVTGSDQTAQALATQLKATVKTKADCTSYDIQVIVGQNY